MAAQELWFIWVNGYTPKIETRVTVEEFDIDRLKNTSRLRIRMMRDCVYDGPTGADYQGAVVRMELDLQVDGEAKHTQDIPYAPTRFFADQNFGYDWKDTAGFIEYETGPIKHDADGSKIIYPKMQLAYRYTRVYQGIGMNEFSCWPVELYAVDRVRRVGFELERIISAPSEIVASDGTLGEPVNITYNAASQTFEHKLERKIGGGEWAVIAERGSEVSYTDTIPLETAESYPDTVWVPVTYRLTTYSGDAEIGSTEKAIRLLIPESIVPEITSFTVTDAAGKAEIYGAYVQTVSKIRGTVEAAGVLGSTITKITASADGLQYELDLNNPEFTGTEISLSGSLDVVVTVTDSRGRTASRTQTLQVLPYSKPKILQFDAHRTGDNEDGFFAQWRIGLADMVSSCQVTVDYGRKGQGYTDPVGYRGTEGSRQQNGGVDADKTWIIRLRVTDSISESESTVELPTAFATVSLRRGGKGVAVGGLCENDGMEIYMDTTFFGDIRIKVDGNIMTLADYIRSVMGL